MNMRAQPRATAAGAPANAAEPDSSLGAMALRAAAAHTGPAMRFHVDGDWRELSYPELGVAVREIGAGLVALGIEPGDRVAVLSDTRPEWTLADCGALCAGATVVPIYQTNSPEECAYVLEHSGARMVFCEDPDQLAICELPVPPARARGTIDYRRRERVRQAVGAEVDEVNQRFARIEQIKRFAILDRELTQADGELTPTMKVKRNVVCDHERETLERLYD